MLVKIDLEDFVRILVRIRYFCKDQGVLMATKKPKKDTAVTEPVKIVETDGNPILYYNDVEDLYAKKIERAGLNMPMLLQGILHELMLLRQDLRR